MELYLKVRLACSEGMSRRQAAKHFNISRDSVAKMLSYSTPPGYRRRSPIRRPKLDAFVSTIDRWLDEDRHVPRKQRHTAKRVFDRLRDECGFTGGYTIIKDYMREREQRRQEVFVPLAHPPGHAQADFGEALVMIGGVEQKAHFFVLDLPHSDGCYVRAYPAAVSEAWVDGHIHAFAFFGAVPQSIVYDNDRCLVAKILPDGTRKRARLFSGFLSHYLIRDRYGRPGKGNDKGSVEGLVGYARRNFMVPIPQFATWQTLQTRAGCPVRRSHVHELLAAAFGHGSWAAFLSESVLADAGVGSAPISGRRRQGSPTTSASNWACVSDSGPDAVSPSGHSKRPAFSRRAAHHTPKPSCTSSFTRVARALANKLPWWACAAPTVATTAASRRSAPARMSTGAVHSHSRSMRITAPAPQPPRAARPRSRLRPTPASARPGWPHRA